MNKYLLKIAEEAKVDDDYSPSMSTRLGVYMATGIGGLAALPLVGLNRAIGEGLTDRVKDSTFTKDDLSTIKQTITEDGLRGKITLVSGSTKPSIIDHKVNSALGSKNTVAEFVRPQFREAVHQGAAFMPTSIFGGKKGIVTTGDSKDLAVTLHEIGHANLDAKTRGASGILRAGGNIAAKVAPVMILSKDQETRDRAMAVYGLGKAPELIDEAQANLYSLRKLQKHQGAKVALKNSGKLGLAYATYLTGAAAGATSLYVGKRIADAIYNADRENHANAKAEAKENS